MIQSAVVVGVGISISCVYPLDIVEFSFCNNIACFDILAQKAVQNIERKRSAVILMVPIHINRYRETIILMQKITFI